MDYDKVKKVLRKARALIATPDLWTKGADRRSEGGVALTSCPSDKVVSRCAGGAIIDSTRAGDVSFREAESLLLDAIKLRTGERYLYLTSWNDDRSRTHAEVMQAFDWAIDDQH